MVLQYLADQEDDPAIPAAHLHELFGQHGPITNAPVLVGRYRGRMDFGYHIYALDLKGPAVLDAVGYAVTFHIKELVVHILGVQTNLKLSGAIPGRFGPYLLRVWPTEGSVIWPPQTMGDPELLDLRQALNQQLAQPGPQP
jgi:hypothetical protein